MKNYYPMKPGFQVGDAIVIYGEQYPGTEQAQAVLRYNTTITKITKTFIHILGSKYRHDGSAGTNSESGSRITNDGIVLAGLLANYKESKRKQRIEAEVKEALLKNPKYILACEIMDFDIKGWMKLD